MSQGLALLFVRCALRLYPERFRSLYAADMEASFLDRWRDAHTLRARVALLLRTLTNLLIAAAAERRHSSFDHSTRDVQGARISAKRGGSVSFFIQDARYAFRGLRRQPAFSLFLIATLAVGIGAVAAVFSVVNGVLLKPLPFADSERLVAVWGRFDPESGFNFPQFPLSNPEFIDYKQESRTFEDVAAFGTATITVGGPGAEPERVPAARVTGNLFSLLRVGPVRGRTFTVEEDRPDGPRVAIVSYGYWRSRFAGDPSLIGRSIPINDLPTTIVGIMPEGYTYPGTETKIWFPMAIDPANPGNRKGHGTRAIGRLAPGATFEQARAETQTIMAAWKARYPDVHTGHYLFIRPLLEDVAGSVRPALSVLLGATAFVLLIVCANVASLMMARGEARTREMAIRGALGAQRGRLVRLVLMESGILSIAGGALGLALAVVGVRLLLAIDPTSIPRATEVSLDARVVTFVTLISLTSALLFGLLPALRGAAPSLQGTLREASLSTTAGLGRQLARRALVAIEVALGVVLVLGAGLMLRSFDRLLSVDPGFRAEGVLMAGVSLPFTSYKDDARVEQFYSTLMERLRATPGIRSASAASGVPLWDNQGVWDFEIEGRPKPRPGEVAWNAAVVVATAGYFETLSIPIARGRPFTPQDDARSMTVGIVSESMAKQFFSGDDPIGRRIRVAGGTATPESWMTIVGIARDVRDEALETPPRPTYYLAHSQVPRTLQGSFRSMSVLVRVDGGVENATNALRQIVRDLDPRLPVFQVQTINTIIDKSVARPRFTTLLLTLFALIGVVLGASGIYGVLAYTVTRRTQEIGIRRALGAPTRRVVRDVVTGGMLPVAAGLVLGITGSFWTTKLLATQLFNVSPTDVRTYLVTVAAVIAVALLASLMPARRALRVSPIVALRAE
jgi:predicted permease